MLSQKSFIELKKGERLYQLILDPSSPLGEVYDVLSEMKAYVFQRIEEVEKLQEKPN